MIVIEYEPSSKAPARKYRVHCKCGTVFTCEDEDREEIVAKDLGLIFDIVTCPHCKHNCFSVGEYSYEAINEGKKEEEK